MAQELTEAGELAEDQGIVALMRRALGQQNAHGHYDLGHLGWAFYCPGAADDADPT